MKTQLKKPGRVLLTRRSLLKLAMTSAGVGLLGAGCRRRGDEASNSTNLRHLLLGATVVFDGQYEVENFVAVVDLENRSITRIPVTFRPHSVAMSSVDSRYAIVFPQRQQVPVGAAVPTPGIEAAKVDLLERRVVSRFTTSAGRHFYGHGAVSTTESIFYSTENNFGGGGGGLIAIRDLDTLQEIDRFDSHGIGPHEMVLIDSGRTALIANGGKASNPEVGPVEYSVPDQPSSLAIVEVESGRLLENLVLQHGGASIRHLSHQGTDRIVVALQDSTMQGYDPVFPVAIRDAGSGLNLVDASDELIERTHGHALSAVIHPEEPVAMVTHPRGDLATFWHVETREMLGSHEVSGASSAAVTADGSHFVIGGSDGGLTLVSPRTLEVEETIDNDRDREGWGSHMYNYVEEA